MHNTSTQLIDGRESQVAEVISHLNKILEFVLENDIHDLQVVFLIILSFVFIILFFFVDKISHFSFHAF